MSTSHKILPIQDQRTDGIKFEGQYYDLLLPVPPLPDKSYFADTRLVETGIVGSSGCMWYEYWIDADGIEQSDFSGPCAHPGPYCLRGYRAVWEHRNGRLFLNSTQGSVRMLRDEPLFADWFSGVLFIKMHGFRSLSLRPPDFESYTGFEVLIEDGREISRRAYETHVMKHEWCPNPWPPKNKPSGSKKLRDFLD